MNTKIVWCVALCVLACGGLILTSCSSGPRPPAPGTPAFFWAAAKETYAAGDYERTVQHLGRICNTQSEYTARAQAWYLVLTSGLAKSNMEMADAFEAGRKARPYNPTPYRRQIALFQTYANGYALQFAQVFGDFEKSAKDPKIALDFTFPTGSSTMSPGMNKIGTGAIPPADVLEDVRRQHLKTGVVQAACRAVGAAEDSAKAENLFKAGAVQVPREVFLLAMAGALQETGQLFSRTKLDDPERLKLFNTRALETLKMLPETKETTALNNKIQKTLKSVSAK